MLNPCLFPWLAILVLGTQMSVYAEITNSANESRLFDGKSLAGWKVTDFTAHAEAHVQTNELVIEAGELLSGITFTNKIPKVNYEVSLEARRLEGSDFFCGLTFPVESTNCTLIVGGWGGGLVGISSLDDLDAAENETASLKKFETGVWYSIRVRVTDNKIEAWLDEKRVVDVSTKGRKLGLRAGEIKLSCPLGLATYQTRAGYRNIVLKELESKPATQKP